MDGRSARGPRNFRNCDRVIQLIRALSNELQGRAHTKSGGRKTYAEARPEVVAFAKELRGSLRKRSAELAARGFMNELGNAFSAASISSMLRLSDSARV